METLINNRFKIAGLGLTMMAALLAFVIFNTSRSVRVDENLPKASSKDSRKARNPDGEKRLSDNQLVSAIIASKNKVTTADRIEISRSFITPDQARMLLSKIDINKVEERTLLGGSILMALCKSGFSEEAWALVDSKIGSVRETQLSCMFTFSNEPLETLLAKFNQLIEPNERLVAITGIVSNKFDMVNFDYSMLDLKSSNDKSALGRALSVRISGTTGDISPDPDNSRLLLEKSISLVKDGVLGAGQLEEILVRDHTIDVYDKWKLLEGVQLSVIPSELESVQSKLVPYMIESDMSRALALITTEQSTKYSVPVLSSAIKRAYSIDPAQANDWVVNNLATIDPATGQRLIFGIGQVAIANNEFQTAQQWADRLLNPGVKQQLLDQIKAAQAPNSAHK